MFWYSFRPRGQDPVAPRDLPIASSTSPSEPRPQAFGVHPASRPMIAVGYLAASALVAVSMTANFLFAMSLGSGPAEKALFVTASLAVDAWKAGGLLFVGLLYADHKRAMAAVAFLLWLACLAWSSASAIGFAALSRGEVVAERASGADERQAAQAKVKRIEVQLAAIPNYRPAPVIEAAILTQAARDPILWRQTKECGAVTKPASAEWCRPVLALRNELASAGEAAKLEIALTDARGELANAGGATGDALAADPQGEALASLLSMSTAGVRLMLGLLLAGLIEAGSALGFSIVSLAAASGHAMPIAGGSASPAEAGFTNAPAPPVKPALSKGGVPQWAAARLVRSTSGGIASSAAFTDYEGWCAGQGLDAITREAFRADMTGVLKSMGAERSRKNDGVRYRGVTFEKTSARRLSTASDHALNGARQGAYGA